jgi:hypothetical protein
VQVGQGGQGDVPGLSASGSMVSGGIGGASPPTPRRLSRLVIAACIALIALLGIGSLLVISLSGHNKPVNYQSTAPPKVLPSTANGKLQLQDVLVNGQLHVNNGIILKPSSQPTNPSLGQLYISSDTKQLSYFNGTAFVPVGSGGTSPTADTVLGVTSNLLKLGNGLTLNQNTIVNSGITNLLGTQNQIAVSSATGSVTLGLPSSVSIPGTIASGSLTTGSATITGSLTAANLIGDASGLTNLNASNLTSGTVADTRLSPNVALLNRNDQSFSGRRQVFRNSTNDTNAFSIQAADGTSELTANTVNHQLTVTDLLPEVAANPGVINTSAVTLNTSNFYIDSNQWLTVGGDGFGRFVYDDTNATVLHFVRCLDADCMTQNTTTVVTNSNVVDYPSVQMGPDGFPRIEYISYDSPNKLHYVQCLNADCTSLHDNVVATGSFYENAFTLDSSGFARITYVDYTNNPSTVYYLQCLNADCSTAAAPVAISNDGYAQAIAMAPSGLPAIAYVDQTGTYKDAHLVTCQDQGCNTTTNINVTNNSSSSNPYYINLLYDKNGLPGLSYEDYASNKVNYISCSNISCSSSQLTTLLSPSGETSAVIGFNGYPLILSADNSNNSNVGVVILACTNESCSSNSQVTVDPTGGYPAAIALGPDGFGRIVDHNNYTSNGNQINYLRLNSSNGAPAGTSIGSVNYRFNNIYNAQLNTQQLVVNNTGSNNLVQVQANNNNVLTVSSTGATTLQNSADSTNAFQVQNAQGISLLNVDTTNSNVIIGGNPNIKQLSKVFDSNPDSVAVNASYAYVANTNGSLQIFNISNPASPSLVSTTATGGFGGYAVAINGNYAYITGQNSNTLQIFNVSNPASPSLVSTTATGIYPYNLTVSGSYAYVVNFNSNAFQIFNISNPASPSLVSTTATGSAPISVAISGSYVYVANLSSGTLQIFNISNPTSPALVGTANTGGNPTFVAVSGSYAYVAVESSNVLNVYNISNPASPALVGTAATATGGRPVSLAISGNYAYVTVVDSNTLQVYNISNPASPTVVGTAATGNYPESVAVSGGYAYVANYIGSYFQVFNVGNTFVNPDFQVQNSSGVAFLTVNVATNSVGIGTSAPTASLDIQATGQTADLLDLQDSSGNVLDNIKANGQLNIGTTSGNGSRVNIAQTSNTGNLNYGVVNSSYNTSIPANQGGGGQGEFAFEGDTDINDGVSTFRGGYAGGIKGNVGITGNNTVIASYGNVAGLQGDLSFLGNTVAGGTVSGVNSFVNAYSGNVTGTVSGFNSYIATATSGASLSNARGISLNVQNGGGGTIQNYTGVYVGSSAGQVSGTRYGVYVAGDPSLFNAGTASDTVLTLKGTSGQTADLLELQNSSGSNLDKFNANGDLQIGGTSSSNSTTAFQIQNSSGTALLTADTTNMKLTVQALVVNLSLTVNGHIISGNSSGGTTGAGLTGACSAPGAAPTVTGNDTAGLISYTTANSGTCAGAPGTLLQLNFANSYGAAPSVVITPASASSAALQSYVDPANVSTASFKVNINQNASPNTTYKFYYHVIQ